MTDLPEERIFPLINGGELIQTGERILFSRSIPGMIPLLTDPNVEMDDVLDTLFAAQEAIKQKEKALLEQFEINMKLVVRIVQKDAEIERLKPHQVTCNPCLGASEADDYVGMHMSNENCPACRHAALHLREKNKQLREALVKSESFISRILEFYGQGLGVINWHQNGESEPWDNFFDENMDGDELEIIRKALYPAEQQKKSLTPEA